MLGDIISDAIAGAIFELVAHGTGLKVHRRKPFDIVTLLLAITRSIGVGVGLFLLTRS